MLILKIPAQSCTPSTGTEGVNQWTEELFPLFPLSLSNLLIVSAFWIKKKKKKSTWKIIKYTEKENIIQPRFMQVLFHDISAKNVLLSF